MKKNMKKLLIVALIGAGMNSVQALSLKFESPKDKPGIAQGMNNVSCQSMPTTDESCEPVELSSDTRTTSDSIDSDASVYTAGLPYLKLGASGYDYVAWSNEAIADELIKLLSTDKAAFSVLHGSPYLKERMRTIMKIANAKQLDCFIRGMLSFPAGHDELDALAKLFKTKTFLDNKAAIIKRCVWLKHDITPMTLLRKMVEGYLRTFRPEYKAIVESLLAAGATNLWLKPELMDAFELYTRIHLRGCV